VDTAVFVAVVLVGAVVLLDAVVLVANVELVANVVLVAVEFMAVVLVAFVINTVEFLFASSTIIAKIIHS
jgi:hypothetical protein